MEARRNYYISNSKFRSMLLPTILMAAANNITLFVDSIVTSILCGSDRLAAIQVASFLDSTLTFIIWTIGIGGSLIYLEKIAQRKKQEGDLFFTTSFLLILTGSILICIICVAFGRTIISFICLDETIRELSIKYTSVQAFTFIPLAYVTGMNYFIRADGNSKIPFIAILTANIINFGMDFVYIKCLNLDIAGASLATLTGYVASAIIVTIYLFSKKCNLKFFLKRGHFFSRLKSIMVYGFPASSIQLYNLFKNMILNRIITGISGAAMIAFSVFCSSMFIPSIIYLGIAQTLSPLAAAFYQLNDYQAVKHLVRRSLLIEIISCSIFALIVMIFPNTMITLFNVTDPDAIAVAESSLRILPLAYIGLGIVFNLTYYLQAIKKLKLAMIISFIDGLFVSSLLAIILGKTIGVMGIWISVSLTPVITISVYLIYALIKKEGLLLTSHSVVDITCEAYVQGDNLTYVKKPDNQKIVQKVKEIVQAIKKINPRIKFLEIIATKNARQTIIQTRDIDGVYTIENISALPFKAPQYYRVAGINCINLEIGGDLK